jgi:DNA-binding GntR family transcriptional regulator
VLELLQVAAVTESIANGDKQWEQNLRILFGEFQVAVALSQSRDSEGPPAWSKAHRAFHDALMAASKSIWLKSMLNTLTAHSERYRLLSARTGVRDPIGEHAPIFAAAVARDVEGATAALRQHLRRTVDVVERSILGVDDEPPQRPSHTRAPLGMSVRERAEG